MLASFVSQGLGVASWPRMFGPPALLSSVPLPSRPLRPTACSILFRPKDRRVLPAVQRFWDFVLEVCAQYQSDE